MKESFYFPHDFDSRHDEKIINMRSELEAEGYGIYWMIIEMLYQASGKLKINSINAIAFELRADKQKVEKLIKNYDLFEIEDEYFYSRAVMDRIAERENRSKIAKENADKRWNKPKKCERNTVKEKKGKESKRKYGDYVQLSDQQYQSLSEQYGEDTIKSKIDDINNYCAGHGKSYKDYSAVVRQWLKKDGIDKKFDWQSIVDDKELAEYIKDKPKLMKEAKDVRPHAHFLAQYL